MSNIELVIKLVIDKIRDEISDNAFLIANPKNTYEFISAIDLDSIDKILDKYKEEGNDKKMTIDKPSYRSVPTFRNYEDYHDAEQYTKGWNDAMDYIFPEAKKAREREAARKNLKLLEAESEEI